MAPMTNKNPAGSVAKDLKSPANKKRKINKNSKMFKFNKYIYQVLKHAHPGIHISCEALKSMNSIITNMMVKLVQKSVKFSLRRRKSRLSARDILAAVMKTFPPQMAKLASSEARKARTTYTINKLCDAMDRIMKTFPPQMAKPASSAARKARTTYAINKLCDAMDRTMLM